MLGLALEGATLVACADVGPGMRRLDEATATALEGRAEIPISAAWTFCLLVSACLSVGDLERASVWSDRIADFARRYSSRYMLAFCRAEYGAVDVWRGRWSQADALLSAAVEDFERSRPAWASGPLAGLAELRRRQGRDAEAGELVRRAGASRSALLCGARLELDHGRPQDAADMAERVLRQVRGERRLDRMPALDVLTHACARAGGLDRAAAALAELREATERLGTPPARAGADRADGVLSAARGDHERARTRFEDALDAYVRAGAPYEAAQTRLELAGSLAALGRGDAAEREAAAARRALKALSADGGRPARGADGARARRARAARPRADQPPGGRAARAQRAHRPPPRREPARQAQPPFARRRRCARRPPRPLKMARSGEAAAPHPA